MEVCTNDNIMMLYNSRQNTKPAENNSAAQTKSGQEDFEGKSNSKIQRRAVSIGSALGLAASLMLLAKFDKKKKYTINPLKMFKGKFKDSYLMNGQYKSKEIISMGAGSIIGGVCAGAVFDKKENLGAKLRESVVQFSNISLPIVFVEALSAAGNFVSEKTMPGWDKAPSLLKKSVSKIPAVIGSMTGLMTGMYVANKASNKLNEKIFHKKDDRPIKVTDFSAHIDDICVAATFVAENNPVTKIVSRFIPLALLVAGNEAGTKTENSGNNK